jgi:hypothetical protein
VDREARRMIAELFQILVGRLQTRIEATSTSAVKMFQILVGRLQTMRVIADLYEEASSERFLGDEGQDTEVSQNRTA